jgi:hypothetical protein
MAENSTEPMIANWCRWCGSQSTFVGGLAALVRHGKADGRTVHTGHGLEHIARQGHQGAGISGRDASLGLAFLDQLDRHAHRGILLLAQSDFDRVVHGHHFGRMVHGQARIAVGLVALQFGADLVFQADEDQPGLRLASCKSEGGRNRN